MALLRNPRPVLRRCVPKVDRHSDYKIDSLLTGRGPVGTRSNNNTGKLGWISLGAGWQLSNT